MFETYFGGWLAMTAAFFSAPAGLLAGKLDTLTVVATAGIALFIAGVIVAVVQRVGRVRRLIGPAIFTAFAPFVIIFAEHTLGWLGRLLICAFGVGAILISIGVIIGRAPGKLPIWLIGLSFVCFVAYFGLVTLLPLLL